MRPVRSANAVRSATSPTTAAVSPPASARQSSRASARRATPTTFAPACARIVAARLPRPELAPVTAATRPSTPKRPGRAAASLIGGEIEVLAREVLLKPDICRARVAFHTLEPRNARGRLGHGARALPGGALPGHDLHVLVHAEPAGVARRPGGRQHVIGARRLVAESDGRLLAEKQRAVAAQPVEPPVQVLGLHGEVLGGVFIRGCGHVLAVAAEDDLGIVPPGGGGV